MKKNMRFRKLPKIVTSVFLAAALICSAALPDIPASAESSGYGPLTLYTPPSDAPAPGALYARAMQANDGSLYASFEQYTFATPVFPIYKSSDNGRSWSQVGSVKDTQHNYGMRYQPFLYQLPQAIGNMPKGALVCAGNCIPNDLSSTEIDLYYSTDGGQNWTFESRVCTGGYASPDGKHDPVWEPFLMVYNNKLICYYSDERDPNHNQKIGHETTTDGKKWSGEVDDVALKDAAQRPGMPVIAKLPNGKYIMTYEIVGVGGSYYQVSANPESWNTTSTGTEFGGTGSPYCVVSGNTVILSCNANRNLYVNNNNAQGSWTQISSVESNGYTRCLVPLQDGSLFEICGGSIGNTRHNTVTYGDMAVPNVSKSNLSTTIDNCTSLLNGASVGTNGGQYMQKTADEFKSEINKATAILNSASSLQEDFDSAANRLNIAKNSFTEAKLPGGDISSNSLVMKYFFNNASSTVDESPNQDGNAVIEGAYSFINDSERGTVLHLNGGDVKLPNLKADFQKGISVSLLIKPDFSSLAWNADIFHLWTGFTSSSNGIYLGFGHNFVYRGTDANGKTIAPWPALIDGYGKAYAGGAWTLVTVTFDGTTAQMYENGVNTYTRKLSSVYSSATSPANLSLLKSLVNNYIGKTDSSDPTASNAIANACYNGSISDFRVYNRVLTASEVSKLSNYSSIDRSQLYTDIIAAENILIDASAQNYPQTDIDALDAQVSSTLSTSCNAQNDVNTAALKLENAIQTFSSSANGN